MPFSVKLITPFQTVAEHDDAEFVFANGVEGDIGILPGHAPLFATLRTGEVQVHVGGNTERFAVSGGFMEAGPASVTIMVETAEHGADIDIDRAHSARKRAEERLANKTDDADIARAEAALTRAINRIHIVQGEA
ncbi:MAG: F0F1 ATP synthase subunit epsilon [Planctomycetes bacterium]|nr:F0F1 ATP synthase subunit epsilon [Planctomycetota bacterium]